MQCRPAASSRMQCRPAASSSSQCRPAASSVDQKLSVVVQRLPGPAYYSDVPACTAQDGLTVRKEHIADQRRQVKSRIQGISLRDMSKIQEPIRLDAKTFGEMSHLRILDFRMPWEYRDKQVFQLDQHKLKDISEELMYFRWDSFPFTNWPSTFIAQNLVELRLRWSKLKFLWSKEVELGKLKVIDLSGSKSLQKFPNLSKAPNVEKMELDGCESLSEFSSDFEHLEKVEYLDFSGCKGLDKLPLFPTNLIELKLPKIVTKLSSHIKSLMKLEDLSIGSEPPIEAASMKTLEDLQLSKSFSKLKSLQVLTLVGISITELPQSIEHLQELLMLKLSWCTKLVRLSSNIHKLTNLRSLQIEHCTSLCSLPQFPESLLELKADFCEALKTLEGDGSWDRLQELERVSFMDCKGLDHNACRNSLEHMIKGRMENYSRSFRQWIYPGKEIPRWFEYKSEGSSITFQSPTRPSLRAAFCVVYAVDQYSPDPDYLRRHDRIIIAAVSGFLRSLSAPISIQRKGVDDNILLWLGRVFTNKASEDNFGTDSAGTKIQFNPFDLAHYLDIEGLKEVKVKRCGVHILNT